MERESYSMTIQNTLTTWKERVSYSITIQNTMTTWKERYYCTSWWILFHRHLYHQQSSLLFSTTKSEQRCRSCMVSPQVGPPIQPRTCLLPLGGQPIKCQPLQRVLDLLGWKKPLAVEQEVRPLKREHTPTIIWGFVQKIKKSNKMILTVFFTLPNWKRAMILPPYASWPCSLSRTLYIKSLYRTLYIKALYSSIWQTA